MFKHVVLTKEKDGLKIVPQLSEPKRAMAHVVLTLEILIFTFLGRKKWMNWGDITKTIHQKNTVDFEMLHQVLQSA